MQIVVTGAAGFLGRAVVEALLSAGEASDASGERHRIERITAVDLAAPSGFTDPRVDARSADLSAPGVIDGLIGRDTALIVHLAAVVSGAAEADFDLGLRVNLDVPRALYERCRSLGHAPRFVTTSSVAVFGGVLPDPVPDDQVWLPQTSYGTQKAVADLLLADYSRRGFIDGRSLRMPTIVVRPGKPNAAASSFASGIIREPVNGQQALCPVGLDTVMWLMSPELAVANILHGINLPCKSLAGRPVINMPGLSVSVGEMLAALRRICGDEVADRVRLAPDPVISKMVATWPGRLDAALALGMGFRADPDFDAIVRAFVETSAPAA